jgi:hypothetical protein
MDLKKMIKEFFSSPDRRVLLLAFCIYLPFTFLGYGSDYDSYNVVWTGRYFAETFDYVPSRVPGFFVYETLTYFFNLVGGSLMTNMASMGMSLLILHHFMQLCREHAVPHYHLLAVILMAQPYYLVNSTCTMDYLFAFGFVFWGLMAIRKGKYFAAGCLMALGIGSRLTSAVPAGIFLAWAFFSQPGKRGKVILSGLVTLLVAFLFYLPPLDFAEWQMHIFSPSVGTEIFWTPILRLGRFVYKTVYFWSPFAFAILVWGALRLITSRLKWMKPEYDGLPITAAAVILGMQAFYLRLPTEPSYLIPTIPFWLILMGIAFSGRRRVLAFLLALVVLSNFLVVNIARPDQVNQATGAQYGLWLEPGHLAQDVRTRLEYMGCGYQPCSYIDDPPHQEATPIP